MPKKSPTLFFGFIIGFSALLLILLLSGVIPGDSANKNGNSNNGENINSETETPAVNGNGNINAGAGGAQGTLQDLNVQNLGFKATGNDGIVAAEENEGIITVDFDSGGMAVIATEDFMGVMRESISAEDERAVIVGGLPGTLVSGVDAKEGNPVKEIFVTKDGYVFEFRGDEDFLQYVQTGIEFGPFHAQTPK